MRSPGGGQNSWSPSIAVPPASSRLRRRAASASDDRDRSPPGRRAAAGRAGGQSEPARRPLRARPSRRRRADLPDRRGGQSRAAPGRLLVGVAAGAGSAGVPRPGGARHRRRRGAAQGAQSRLRRQGTVGDAPPRRRRAHRADGCGAAVRAARALASRLPARAAHQCRRPHRPRRSRGEAAVQEDPFARGGSPPSSTGSTASARRSSLPPWPKRKPKRWPRSASRRRAPSWSPPAPAGIPAWSGWWRRGSRSASAGRRLRSRSSRAASGTGSGRSIPGVDLGRVVRRAVAEGPAAQGRRARDGGGDHSRQGQPVGGVPRLSRKISAAPVAAARADDGLLIDGAVTAAGADVELVATIARRSVRRRQPRAGSRAAGSHARLCRGGRALHVRARLHSGRWRGVKAIAFRAAGQPLGEAL